MVEQAAPGAMQSEAPLIELRGIRKQYGGVQGAPVVEVLHGVDLSIRRGEFVAIMGQSGSGKSTLMHILGCLDRPSSGQYLFNGADVSTLDGDALAWLRREAFGFVFQGYHLIPTESARENVEVPAIYAGVSADERATRAAALLTRLGLADRQDNRPHQLSGGQQQRVALARSLVKRPKLLLLDEPMSALDKQIRQKTQIELVRILDQVGVTCIMVTHDQDEAMTMAHRLAVMTEGQIIQSGTPQEVYTFPSTRFVAGFIGSTNLFTGIITVDEADHVMIESEALGRPLYVNHGVNEPLGMEVHVSIRPEHVRVLREAPATAHNWSRGVVSHMAWMGSHARYQVRLDSGQTMEAQVPSMVLATDEAPGVDDEVFVSWASDSATVLAS